MRKPNGFTLVQVLVVVAIIVVVAVIAVPRLLPTQRFATEDAAVTTMYAALTDAVSQARAGDTRTFTPASVELPAGVVVNFADYPAPDGSKLSPEFFLQGGRGTPLLADAKRAEFRYPATVAVILADTDQTWATALVVNLGGIVSRYEWRNKQWAKQ